MTQFLLRLLVYSILGAIAFLIDTYVNTYYPGGSVILRGVAAGFLFTFILYLFDK